MHLLGPIPELILEVLGTALIVGLVFGGLYEYFSGRWRSGW